MGSKPSKPAVVQQPDPQKEAEKAANLAAKKANAETASRKVRRRASSLLSSAGARGTDTVLASGKDTLGS